MKRLVRALRAELADVYRRIDDIKRGGTPLDLAPGVDLRIEMVRLRRRAEQLEEEIAARELLLAGVGDVLCKEPDIFWANEKYRVSVSDSRGLALLSVEMVSFRATVLMPTRASP